MHAGCSKADPQTNAQMGDYNTLHSLVRSVIKSKILSSLIRRPPQPSVIPPGSVNGYQLQLGRQRQVWLIPIVDERVGVQVKLRSLDNVPYLSTSEVMFRRETLYQVYVPLPLP